MSVLDLMDKHTAVWARHAKFFAEFRSRYLGHKRWLEVCENPYEGVKVSTLMPRSEALIELL